MNCYETKHGQLIYNVYIHRARALKEEWDVKYRKQNIEIDWRNVGVYNSTVWREKKTLNRNVKYGKNAGMSHYKVKFNMVCEV